MVAIATAFVAVRPDMRPFRPALRGGLRSAEPDADRAGRATGQRFSGGFTRSVGGLGRGLAGLFAGAGVAAAAKWGLGVASSNEQAQISFETMLGSATKASKFLGQLKQFAATTPFEFPELQTAASSLISIGVKAEKVIPIMTTLGDVTAGMGTGSEGIKRATVALQQMNAAGRITGEDLNQLRDAGVPVYDLLAAATGRSKQAIVEMVAKGKLGRQELGQLMSALESGKGLERFSGLMDKQSRSLTGMVSTFRDTLGQGLADLIAPHLDKLKAGLAGVSDAAADLFAGLSGKGKVAGFAGPFNTLGLGVRGLIQAFRDGDVTSDGFVGALERVGATARRIFDEVKGGVRAFVAAFRDGGDEVTSAGFAGVLEAVGVEARNAFDYFRSDVLPVLRSFGGFLRDNVVPAVGALVGWLVRNRDIVVPLVGAVAAGVAVYKTIVAVTRAWAAAQVVLNGVLLLNPIGLVIAAVAALAVGIVIAWKRSETFRNVVKASWDAIRAVVSTSVRFVVDRFLGMVGALLSGAAKAFGWIPGLGPKLRRAAGEFAGFRDDVNRNLGGIRDKSVTIRAKVNDVAATLTKAGVSRAEALNIANRELKGRTYFGGPIRHGVRSKDSALFLARRDEHVWTPEEVDAAGGHAGVFRLRAAAKRGELRGFAQGGPVRFDVRAATLTADQLAHAMSPVGRTLNQMTAAVSAAASRGASRIVARALQTQLATVGGGPAPQAGDYARVGWRGVQVNARTARMIVAAEKLLSGVFRIMQGSFSTRVAASGGTHAGGGVVDVNSDGTSWAGAVRALRRAGFAAWHRSPAQGPWGHHIHAVAIGDRQLSPSAANQVRSFRRGGDGLGGRDRIFDRGGWLQPGWNPPVFNGTGRPEHLTPTDQQLPPIIVEFRDERLRDLIDVRFDTRSAEHARRVRVGRR